MSPIRPSPSLQFSQCRRIEGIGREVKADRQAHAWAGEEGTAEHFTRPSDFFRNNWIVPKAV
jgi:hypothetical protein